MAAADELIGNVVNDVTQPRTALKGRCDAEIAVIRRPMARMSTKNVAMTAATRPCKIRGLLKERVQLETDETLLKLLDEGRRRNARIKE